MKNFWNMAVCLITTASILLYPYHSAVSVEPETKKEAEEVERRIAELGQKAADFRDALKRGRFDPQARVDSSDYDLETLVDFVRDEISFHPYAGTMRGATGTLRARSGNSLDQALLLAQMLKTAGYDARIVRAELTDEQARQLLDVTANAPSPESTDYINDALNDTFDMSDAQPSNELQIEETTYYKDTQRHSQILLQTLEGAGVTLTPQDATERLIENIRPYFWVQHRDSPSQEWQQAHPAFGKEQAPKALNPAEVFGESIPEEYQHTFSMTAWVEQLVAGKIEKHRIMDPWSAPVANLNGVPIRFQNIPNGLTEDNVQDLELILTKTNTLTPFVGKSPAAGAMAFDLQGRSIDYMAAASPAAGIVKTVGDKFVTATSSLNGDADDNPVMALHSMYLEFTFNRPGAESETRKRYLVPPRSNYDEDRNEVLRQLITSYSYMVTTGDQPMDYITDQYFEHTIKELEWIKYLVFRDDQVDQKYDLPKDSFSTFPTQLQLWNMERLPVEAGIVRYRAQPALVGIRDGFRDKQTVFSEVDVVWNAIESIKQNKNGWTSVPMSNLVSGVWDTLLEETPHADLTDDQHFYVNTPRVFDEVLKQKGKLMVLSPNDSIDSKLNGLDLEENEKQFVIRDLKAGYTIIIPEQKPDLFTLASWWRINTTTGETLGMVGDGYGATALEYLLLLGVVAALLLVATKVVKGNHCEGYDSLTEKACCLHKAFVDGGNDLGKTDAKYGKMADANNKMMCGVKIDDSF